MNQLIAALLTGAQIDALATNLVLSINPEAVSFSVKKAFAADNKSKIDTVATSLKLVPVVDLSSCSGHEALQGAVEKALAEAQVEPFLVVRLSTDQLDYPQAWELFAHDGIMLNNYAGWEYLLADGFSHGNMAKEGFAMAMLELEDDMRLVLIHNLSCSDEQTCAAAC